MPAIIPFIPLIASGVGAIGGILGSKKSAAPSAGGSTTGGATTTPFDPSIAALNNSQKALADFQLQQGQAVLPKALSSLGQSEDFYKTLLSGDRGAMSSLLGPQINAIGQQGQAQQRSLSELSPRGGQLSDRLGGLSTSSQGQINDAMLSYRPAAAQSLAGIGQTYGNIGTGLISGSGGTNASSLSALLGQRGQDISAYLQQQAQRQENQRALGTGIGGILSILLGPGGILNKKGGGGGTGGDLPIGGIDLGTLLGNIPGAVLKP